MTLPMPDDELEEMIRNGLESYTLIAADWQLTISEAAALMDLSADKWKRSRKPPYTTRLSHDQVLRLSAILGLYRGLNSYFGTQLANEWVKLPSKNPLFGGVSPLTVMIHGGLPMILQTRQYVDALGQGL